MYRVLFCFFPHLQLSLYRDLLYGFLLAVFWGIVLLVWERFHYAYGLEDLYSGFVSRYAGSTKREKIG